MGEVQETLLTSRSRLIRALDELGPLPVLTGTVAAVRALAADPEASTEEIVATIGQDEAFAANILRLANSAWAGRRLPVTSIRHAVMLLGRAELIRLALAARTYQFLEEARGNGRLSRGQMHLHSLAVASYAMAAAERCGADVDMAAEMVDFTKLQILQQAGTAMLAQANQSPQSVLSLLKG